METILMFLRDNWKFVVESLLLVISFIVLCAKKTKVTVSSSVISDMLVNLPKWIIEAENEVGVGNGEIKLKYVFSKCLSFITNETGLSTNQVLKVYGVDLVNQIEEILNTPQKKGDQ